MTEWLENSFPSNRDGIKRLRGKGEFMVKRGGGEGGGWSCSSGVSKSEEKKETGEV